MNRLLLTLLLASVLFAGCPAEDDDDDSSTPADDDTGDDDTGDDDTTPGDDDDDIEPADCVFVDPWAARIEVIEELTPGDEGQWYAQVSGRVYDGPEPTHHELTFEDGSCRYKSLQYGFCDPSCDPMEVCTWENVCEPYPTGLGAGTMTVDGLVEAVEVAPSNTWYWGPWTLPADIYAPGDPIDAAFSGDDFPAVAMNATGVETMDVDLAAGGIYSFTRGADAEITWTAGTDPRACVLVTINGENVSHGLPYMDIIECVGTDTGSLTIPQTVADEFPLGTGSEICVGHDCPPSSISRYTLEQVDTEYGPAELRVRSTVLFRYEHLE
jgi:hypothetical protein